MIMNEVNKRRFKQKGYKDITTLYIVTVFQELIPQVCNEYGCVK